MTIRSMDNGGIQKLTLTRSLFGKHKLTFGSEVTDNFQQDQSNYDPDGSPPVGPFPTTRRSGRFTGKANFALTRKFSLSAGVRYDHYFPGSEARRIPALG